MKLRTTFKVTIEHEVDDLSNYEAATLEEAAKKQQGFYERDECMLMEHGLDGTVSEIEVVAVKDQ